MEIAVISGKGGTGKSSVTAAFASLGHNVVLADCDVDAANLYLLFHPDRDLEEKFTGSYKAVVDAKQCTGCGICAEHCRFDAISVYEDKAVISEVSCDGCFLCSRICPENAITMVGNDDSRLYSGRFRHGTMVYGRLAPGEENSGKLVNLVREKARGAALKNGSKAILLDGPPGIGCPVISTVTGVDKVVIVTEPTVSGLNDLERVTEVVTSFNLKPLVIINKYDLNEEMAGSIGQWCAMRGIQVAGLLPFDPAVTDAMVRQQSIVEYDPGNAISLKLISVWENLVNDENRK